MSTLEISAGVAARNANGYAIVSAGLAQAIAGMNSPEPR
jgi:hypothetical protein